MAVAEGRDPLGSMSTNIMLSSSPSPPAKRTLTPSPPKRLFPIFLSKPDISPSSSSSDADFNKSKRAKIHTSTSSHKASSKRSRPSSETEEIPPTRTSLPNYFAPTVPLRVALCSRKPYPVETPAVISTHPQVWRRSRKRLGQPALVPSNTRPIRVTYLSSLVTGLTSNTASPPSTVMMPSLNNPTGHDRDFDPSLVVAFNNCARMYTLDEAKHLAKKRLLAIGSEEGAVRIVDIDEPQENGSSGGLWWQAHANGVFDLKWTSNDSRLLSASADQSLRLYDVCSGNPKVLATLRGHTSTIKATVFLDANRGSNPVYDCNIVASGGRDGNINIYDLRCQGVSLGDDEVDSSRRRSHRMRNNGAMPTATATDGHIIHPVITLRQPHNAASSRRTAADPRSVSRTITSLVALESMPGILASGGSFDGVVKLWDIRCPDSTSSMRPKATPYGVLPDPTIAGANPARRARSINALCEQTSNGDLYVLSGDSKIHILRPSAAKESLVDPTDAILGQKFVHPDLVTRSFYIRMSLSPDGRYLACGSSHAGVMAWDTTQVGTCTSDIVASRLRIPAYGDHSPEVIGVDWAKDALAASSDDCVTRLWRANLEIAQKVREDPAGSGRDWSGIV